MKNRKKIMMWLLVAVIAWAVWHFFLKKKAAPTIGTETKEGSTVATNTGTFGPIFGPPDMPPNQALSFSGKRLIIPGYSIN